MIGSDLLDFQIRGADSNPHLMATSPLQEFGVMDNEMAPEFVVDQSTYYPAAADYYGDYCTGKSFKVILFHILLYDS